MTAKGITMNAYDDPDMYVRIARKVHRCCGAMTWNSTPTPSECTGKIAKGEQYVEYMGEAPPAYASGDRFCHACSVAAGLLPAQIEGTKAEGH